MHADARCEQSLTLSAPSEGQTLPSHGCHNLAAQQVVPAPTYAPDLRAAICHFDFIFFPSFYFQEKQPGVNYKNKHIIKRETSQVTSC